MALTESTVLTSVNIRPDIAVIEVAWENRVLRDGDLIAATPHRKAYTADQQAEFEAEVDGAAAYVAAVGW